MKPLFLFATLAEARVTIERGSFCQTGENLFSCGDRSIVIIGMGPKAALRGIERLPTDGVRWINIGIAGAFDRALHFGQKCQIGSTAFLSRGRVYDHLIVPKGGDTILYTSPTPVYEAPHFYKGVVDMEGHVVAKVALQKKVPLSIIKVVSDYCSPDTSEIIRKKLGELSELLSIAIAEEI